MERIQQKATELGFDAVGITAPQIDSKNQKYMAELLADGWHGDMTWLVEKFERRKAPQNLWPEVRSIIMLGMSYAPAEKPAVGAPNCGYISAYARGKDYHDVLKGRAKKLAEWVCREFSCEVKVFTDTAPVMEKLLAEQAGIGWQGKHTNLVSPQHGSWLFLAAIYTTHEFQVEGAVHNRCGTCERCMKACPTGAIATPYKMDARRCISYLTIEHKGHIDKVLRPLIGNRIYGCDECLAVCPWNKFAKASREAAFMPRAELTAPKLAELVKLDDAAFRQLFSGSPIKRIGRDRFIRNVLIAIGNSGDASLLSSAQALLHDASEIVREAAEWAVNSLIHLSSGDLGEGERETS